MLPEFSQICGVYINTTCQLGIESAVNIYRALKVRQGQTGKPKYFYALLHQPVASPERPIYMAGWARAVQPWTASGLVEFAQTGVITPENGNPFPPNHFELLKLIGRRASTQPFIDDLSMIKSGRNNLLHLAVKFGRNDKVLKFFLLWNVSPHEIGGDYQSAVNLNNGLKSKFFNSNVSANRRLDMKQFMRANPNGVCE